MSVATHDFLTGNRTLHRPAISRSAGLGASIAHTIDVWRTRISDRQAFAHFDHRDLRDLRLSQWEVERELSKPFWRG